jgi:hypothetical protein
VSDDGDHEESYDHIEGAYNPRDYMHLNITSDVKELFMYIERYKPQEVDLDTPLKCFIPEYIPAIGELDPFLKVRAPVLAGHVVVILIPCFMLVIVSVCRFLDRTVKTMAAD